MRRSSLLLLSLLALGQCAPKTDAPKAEAPQALPGKPVPAAWIEALRRYRYQTDNLALLKGFEQLIAPDTLDGAHALPHYVNIANPEPGGLLNCLFVNLDDDPATEVIGLFGYHHSNPLLAVFKEVDHSWRLLYTESIWAHGTPPELQVGNTFSAHKPFYVQVICNWGSDTYCSHYRFFKLIDSKVYPCLELVEEAYETGGELEKEVSTKLRFNTVYADELWAAFEYRFSPGYNLRPGKSWQGLEGVDFVRDTRSFGYHWNESGRRYEPDEPYRQDATGALLDSADLTAAKVAYFTNFGNDSLFLSAFDYELRQLRRAGSAQQKTLLREYQTAVRQHQARRRPRPSHPQ